MSVACTFRARRIRAWKSAGHPAGCIGISLPAIAFAAILLSGGGSEAAEKIKVASAFGTIWTSAQPTFCNERGEFAKADLDVDVLTTRGGSETVQAVITGAADIGYGPGANAVIAASLQGARIKIVSGYFNGQSDSFFYVPVDSPVKEIKDLKGKTVAFSRPGSVSEQILLLLKKERNLDFKTVSGGTLDAIFTMTMTRQIDVGYSIPPSVLEVVEKGQARVLFTGDIIASLRNITSRVTIARDDVIAKRRPSVAKFLHVLNRCIEWMYANPERSAKMYGELNRVSETIAIRAISFYPRKAMEFSPILGFQESLQDAFDTKFIDRMPTEAQIKDMMDVIDIAK